MKTIITRENWKDYRSSEANRLFSVGLNVQYTHGYTRFDENNFGRVTRITPAGIIYVASTKLKEVARDCDQGGGWIEYDPKTVVVNDEVLKFLPNLRHNSKYDTRAKRWNLTYSIAWDGPKEGGRFDLRKLEVGNKGLVRVTLDSML
jgi:hypothetical protein